MMRYSCAHVRVCVFLFACVFMRVCERIRELVVVFVQAYINKYNGNDSNDNTGRRMSTADLDVIH